MILADDGRCMNCEQRNKSKTKRRQPVTEGEWKLYLKDLWNVDSLLYCDCIHLYFSFSFFLFLRWYSVVFMYKQWKRIAALCNVRLKGCAVENRLRSRDTCFSNSTGVGRFSLTETECVAVIRCHGDGAARAYNYYLDQQMIAVLQWRMRKALYCIQPLLLAENPLSVQWRQLFDSFAIRVCEHCLFSF